MKRSALVTILCSLIVIVLLIAAVLLVNILNKVYDSDKNKLVIASASASAYYTGQPLVDSRWDILQGNLQKGHKLEVTVSGTQTDVGRSTNTLVAKITDAGGKDVTSQYKIEYKPGTLNVKSRRLYVSADSAMKLYDGTPLTSDSYTLENPSLLAAGARLEVTTEGSVTDPGVVNNVIIDVKVFDKNGVDITKNYSFRKRQGTLQVYSADAIIIKSASDHKTYDASPLTCDEAEVIFGRVREGHSLVISVTGKCTGVGSVKNDFVVTIWDEANNDVTSEYEIVKILGDLIIMSAEEPAGQE